MEKITQELLEIINKKEKATTEFKESKNELPKSLFETICAMLNRNGGHIFLGVADDGTVVGVNKEAVTKMKKDFANLCNNPNKIEPNVYLIMYEYMIDNKIVLYIPVPESSSVHKTNNIIFDRNFDGDYKVTLSERIGEIYIRKSGIHTENRVFPDITINDLNPDLIKRAKQMAMTNSKEQHIWTNMTDEEILRSLDLYGIDKETGKEGLILAAILIFGTDRTIMRALSHHRVDAIYRVKNIDRYDDRDDIRTNLIDTYYRLIAFIDKHLDDRFYLEGVQRIDVRNKIAREICANLLMHNEYSIPFPPKLIIEKDKMWTENANRPKKLGEIDINSFSPYSKNPKIAKIFKEIGLADELGSGIRNMVKYTEIYSGGVPKLIENDIFTTIIPINEKENVPVNVLVNVPVNVNKTENEILNLIRKDNNITHIEIANALKITDKTAKRNTKKLKEKGIIERIGSDKTGYWKILK